MKGALDMYDMINLHKACTIRESFPELNASFCHYPVRACVKGLSNRFCLSLVCHSVSPVKSEYRQG